MVLRRLSMLAVAWVLLVALLPTATAVAQEDGTEADDEAPAETAYYGDTELIDSLRTYGLLTDWTDASPVSPQASLLLVTGNGSYETQRQAFLDALEAWAARTELVRSEVERVDSAQANTDRLRSVVIQVRDALVRDDRLASDSKTLLEIEDALGQLAAVQLPERVPEELEDSIVLAEIELNDLLERAEAELTALNGVEPAFSNSGTGAFVGFDDLVIGLNGADQLIELGRNALKPAREQSEQLLSSAFALVPNLHAARMLGSTDVGGLSVVTIDAYIRAAARSSCSVDWALLAGIGQVESNHGRIGGASVSRSGQVSTTILGPLLDGGRSERKTSESHQFDDLLTAVAEVVETARRATQAAFQSSLWGLPRRVEDQGNGFAVVVDSDGGRLDGNDQWDRAIGPMQFLPETWSRWATDGNGDGIADPHNLYDAAASAARFLCDLSASRGPSPSTFVLGYNSSTSYVRSVISTAQGLRALSLPAG